MHVSDSRYLHLCLQAQLQPQLPTWACSASPFTMASLRKASRPGPGSCMHQNAGTQVLVAPPQEKCRTLEPSPTSDRLPTWARVCSASPFTMASLREVSRLGSGSCSTLSRAPESQAAMDSTATPTVRACRSTLSTPFLALSTAGARCPALHALLHCACVVVLLTQVCSITGQGSEPAPGWQWLQCCNGPCNGCLGGRGEAFPCLPASL